MKFLRWLAFVVAGGTLSLAQGTTNPYNDRLRCQAPNPPANPYRRKFGCKDVHFETKETLSGDWSGARGALRDEGITPGVLCCSTPN